MISNPITAILFDFGGVLAEEGFRNGLLSMASEQGLDSHSIVERGMQAVYDSGFVLGTGTAADFWSLMRQRTGLKGDDETLTVRILNGFIVRPGMIELAKELNAKGYLTGILSDQTYWLDELDKVYHFSKAFRVIYNSYYLGKGKRDSTLFLDVAADMEISPDSILFVDDDINNIMRAKSTGMRAVQFVDEAGFRSLLKTILNDKLEIQ